MCGRKILSARLLDIEFFSEFDQLCDGQPLTGRTKTKKISKEMKWNKARILQAKRDISTDIRIWSFKVTKAQTDFAIQWLPISVL